MCWHVISGEIFFVGYINPQERSTGKWWLMGNNLSIGYWPNELFNHLGSTVSSKKKKKKII